MLAFIQPTTVDKEPQMSMTSFTIFSYLVSNTASAPSTKLAPKTCLK